MKLPIKTETAILTAATALLLVTGCKDKPHHQLKLNHRR